MPGSYTPPPVAGGSGGASVTEALVGDTGFEYQGNWGDGGGDGVRLFKIGNIAFAVGYAYYTGAYSDSIVANLPAGWHSVDGTENVGTANSEDFIQCSVSSAALVTHKLAATMPDDGYVFFQASWAVS